MDTNSNSKNKTGVLLIGHGSRLPYNKEVVNSIADKYAKKHPELNVEVGFMELAKPNIPTAFNKLKKTGVEKIIVMPVFLAHGMHTKRDIPKILGLELEEVETADSGHEHHHHHGHQHDEEAETIEFDGELIYIEPLGADDAIVDIVSKRVSEYL